MFRKRSQLVEHCRHNHPDHSAFGRLLKRRRLILDSDEESVEDRFASWGDIPLLEAMPQSVQESIRCSSSSPVCSPSDPCPPSQSFGSIDSSASSLPSGTLAAALLRWRVSFGVSRATFDALMTVLKSAPLPKDVIGTLVGGRSVERRAECLASVVAPLSATKWKSLWRECGATHETTPPFPRSPVYSILDWTAFVLSSPRLGEALMEHLIHGRARTDDEVYDTPAIRDALQSCASPGSGSQVISLPVLLFYDSFEPFMSSHTPVGGFYFTFASFPRSEMTQSRNRFLLGLVDESSESTRCEFWDMLRLTVNLMREMRTIFVAGENRQVVLRLAGVIGDMKERNRLCSMTGPTSDFFCLRCMAERSNVLRIGDTRTKEKTMALASEPGSQRDCGIDKLSALVNPLFTLEYFDPHQGICLDYAHDELLGVAKFEIQGILSTMCQSSLRILAQRVRCDGLWPKGRTKIIDLSFFSAPLGKAANIEEFFEVAPIAFRGLITEERMSSLRLHCSILRQIRLMDWNDEGDRNSLHEKLLQHTRELLHLYPHLSRKPKIHNRLHFVEQIARFGRLPWTSTQRFEAKHLDLKRFFIRGCRGRQRAIWSAARRESVWQSARSDLSGSYVRRQPSEVPVEPWRIAVTGDPLFDFLTSSLETEHRFSTLFAYKSFRHNGFDFSTGDSLSISVRSGRKIRIGRFDLAIGGESDGAWKYFVVMTPYRILEHLSDICCNRVDLSDCRESRLLEDVVAPAHCCCLFNGRNAAPVEGQMVLDEFFCPMQSV